MIEIDREAILNGTPEKQFIIAQKELHANFNETTAKSYKEIYEKLPLSFILDHSREIFSEPYYGMKFYTSLVKSNLINPLRCEAEEAKIKEYADTIAAKVSTEQMQLFNDMMAAFKDSISYAMKDIMKPVLVDYDKGLEYIDEIFDFLYEGKLSGDTTILDSAAEEIFGSSIAQVQVCIGLLLGLINEEYLPYLAEATADIRHASTEAEYEFAATMKATIKALMTKTKVSALVSSGSLGYRIRTLWNQIANGADMTTPFQFESVEEVIDTHIDISELHPSANVLAIMEELEASESVSNQIRNALIKEHATVVGTLKAYPKFEDIEDTSEKAIYQNLIDKQVYLEEELAKYEWEADGSPNAVLQAEIKTSRDIADKNSRRPMYRQLVGNNTSVARSAEAENKLCNSIQKDIAIIKDPKSTEEELAGVKRRMADYEKDVTDNDYRNAKTMLDNLNQRIYSEEFASRCGDLGDLEFAEFLNMENMFEDNEEQKKSENEVEDPKQKPQNSNTDSGKDTEAVKKEPESKPPKRDFVDTIQDKALDREAKVAAKNARRNAKFSKLKNAARAVTSSPRRMMDSIKSFKDSFVKMDDNRRKKFLLKPGNRTRISKMFHTALKLNLVAHAKLAMVPFLGMINHLSKDKDKRIRNELVRELDTEIKICQEKINDAASQGDNAQKYELMRIHDKLVAEKQRVGLNSKYI